MLFTTLAPSGAVAYALMSFPIIRGRLSDDAHRRIDKALCIPLIVSLVGLVASATHLGNPANALYVFMGGGGRSPLSNEVFSAVIFLAFSGVYWLYSFTVKAPPAAPAPARRRGVRERHRVHHRYRLRVLRGHRHHMEHPVFPVKPLGKCAARWAGPRYCGFKGCAVEIAGESLWAAHARACGRRAGGMPCRVCPSGGVVLPAENAVSSAGDLVPHYALLVCVFAVFAAAGIAVDALSLFRPSVSREGKASPDEMTISVVRASVAALLVLAGIFVMRFLLHPYDAYDGRHRQLLALGSELLG